MEIELEAFVKGSRTLMIDLIMMDPWTKSREQAEKLFDEILALPYHEEMRTHFK